MFVVRYVQLILRFAGLQKSILLVLTVAAQLRLPIVTNVGACINFSRLYMSIDQKIFSKRAELQKLKIEQARLCNELHALFREKAESICPIALGTKVEYESGKFGQVDRIEYVVPGWDELDQTVEVYWAVSGRKINKSGEFGVKDFSPVGPATHNVIGTVFTRKSLAESLGI